MAFFASRAEPPVRAGKRVFSESPLIKESLDHPLTMPSNAPREAIHSERLTAKPLPFVAPSAVHAHAGRASERSTSVRTVLTGFDDGRAPPRQGHRERHEYNHPTFQISRSQDGSTAKDLLYGTPPPPPAPPVMATVPPEAAGHPLLPAFEALAQLVPNLPRDAQGGPEEGSVRNALAHVGVDLSMDGFAELLARCDVSPTGFPPFSDFLLCVSRPARAPPPPSVAMGGVDALPPSGMDHVQAASMVAPPVASPVPAPTLPPPAAAVGTSAYPAVPQLSKAEAAAAAIPPSSKAEMRLPPAREEKSATWGRMQLEEQIKLSQQGTARLGVGPAQPNRNFPLGVQSSVPMLGTNVKSIYSKDRHVSSQKFTNSFNPDHFLF